MDKTEPINEVLVSQWKILNNSIGELEGQIEERINYIVNTICRLFKTNLDYWDAPGSGENSDGIFENIFRYDGCINVELHLFTFKNMVIILNDGSEWGFEGGEIPTNWLYEDFEQELIDGKKRYEDELALKKLSKKEKLAAKKIKDKKIIESAKMKLSKEELKALKIK